MATNEEEDGMTLSDLYGFSSCEGGDGDESSVDIYDGLDSTPVVSINCATKVPVKSSLNLFDEILIEEGTAKEATFNELQAEHEKCKQQLQELMKKLQEIQKQNSLLQSENQSLKKNISALIKTARVEINRKDEEICNLQRRLTEVPVHQNTYSRTYKRSFEESKAKSKPRDFIPENNSKTDHKTKEDLSKDVSHSYSLWDTENKKFHLERKYISCIPQSHPEQLHKDGVQTKLIKVDSSCDKEKMKKEMKSNEHYGKDNNCRYKTKVHRNIESPIDGPGKSQINPEKLVRNALWNDRKDLKLKSSQFTEKRIDNVSSTKEKQSVPKETLMLETVHTRDSRVDKLKIINQKDFKTENKEETGRQKTKQDKFPEQQRTGKVIGLPESNTLVRNPEDLSKSHVEDKIKHNDCKKNKTTNDHGLQRGKSSPPHSSNREQKLSNSKKDSRKYEFEHSHSRSARHRTEAKRKNEREKPRENRNSETETGSKETPQKTVKENIKIEERAKKEEKKSFPTKEMAKIIDVLKEQMPTKVGRDDQQSKSKDLKLSFMQKLNLTLSPAKKQTDKPKSAVQSTDECEMEVTAQEIILAPAEPLNTNATKEVKMLLVPGHTGPLHTNLEKVTSICEIKTKEQNKNLTEISDQESAKVFLQNAAVQHELVGNVKHLPDAEFETLVAPSLDHEARVDHSFNDLETISSVDFDSFSVIDEINGTDSDSSMSKEESSNCIDKRILDYSGGENSPPLRKASVQEDKKVCVNISVNEQKPENLNQSFPNRENYVEACDKGLNTVSQTRDPNPVSADDENSILSIDLNHMRYIPKAISPLNSPIRPLGNMFRMESSFKGPVTSYNTAFVPDSAVVYLGRNHSSELNKENQKPVCTGHQILEESQLSMSSDELEEGEIVSDADDEPKVERNSENNKKLKRRASDKSNMSKITCSHKAKSVPSNEDTGKLASGKKSKEKPKEGTIMFPKEIKKNKTVSIDCLEKIVQISAEPSTLHEFMQMLKAVRKQVRKNYMKFKIQFPIQQFHKIIDSSVLNFTSLIKYLDFSKMSKSSETIKVNLCEVIESELNQIKKNTAIEYLFEKQQSDMKKKLWKLVDEQFDFLFDKIREILHKLCNLISLGNENDDRKLDTRKKERSKRLVNSKIDRKKSKNSRMQKLEKGLLPKPVAGNQLSKTDHQERNKIATHKNMVTKQKHSHTECTTHSQTEIKEHSIEDTVLKTGKYEKEGLEVIGDSHKSDISSGPLTEQQMSGLTFNLVNDAQMGEMFKSLLQGSSLSEKNVDFIDENQWEFRTPEKRILDGQNCGNDPSYETEETISKENQVESRVLDSIKWPLVSPERDSTFLARLQMPIDPDILDESCMFEIPTSPTLKKSEACVMEKTKSLVSSILLEDLAVSLTIPSPLKSDAHLSFLKPDVFGSVPEDVLNAHFSEDAHLDEEDASEQEIHLALESDNSSTKSSSSWANIPAATGFQYCPSLPMQAVIMEKSNDHFIVKIRRATTSASSIDPTAIPNEPLISVTEKEKNEIICTENLSSLNSQSTQLEEREVSEESINRIDPDPEDKMHKHIMEQVSNSLESEKEISVCLETDSVPELFECNPDVPDDVLNNVESLILKNRQEPSCNISELQQPYSNPSHTQDPDLLGSCQPLQNGIASAKPYDLQESPKELRISSLSLKEPLNKMSQNTDAPGVFKLPQTFKVKVFQEKHVANVKDFPVSSIAVPPLEQVSSQNHFDTNIGLTEETHMEIEADSWVLVEQSALNGIMRSVVNEKKKYKADGDCEVADSSKRDVEEINLTAVLPDKPTIDGNLDDDQRSPIKLEKESKKRKQEPEEISSAKKQKKESNELSCKKNGRNSKSSKERPPVASGSSSMKPASVRDKDPLSSTFFTSPSNLCAKNIIKKKGEVVISWTRNDDREILLECQKKGPSGKTFTSLADHLNKTPIQVEERFKQLVKLFRMSNGS